MGDQACGGSADDPSTPGFSSTRAGDLLAVACREVGLDPDGARLLRFGENASYRLAGDASSVVVRIARDRSRLPVARREVCVARWLAQAQVPAVRVDERFDDQPLLVDGHPVTLWRAVDYGPVRPGLADLAQLLRQLHELDGSPCRLPVFDPLSTVWPRLRAGLDIPDADMAFLWDRCGQVAEAVANLEPALPVGPVHGDAHTGNLLGAAGAALLSDFEVVAIGMREWDLIPAAVGQARLGIPAADLDEFATVYGFDVRGWDGYCVLRQARELGMTTWLAQNVAESEQIADEVTLRLASLRDGDQDRAWTAF
jgi:Ser/Thr protein kinase RdoA (MazF antagonist)